MACLLTPTVTDSFGATRDATWRAGHATKDAFTNTYSDPCSAMHAMCRASFASAIAATRVTAMAINVAATAGEASRSVMPMPGVTTGNAFARSFAASLDAAASTAESLAKETPTEEEDYQMKVAMALSLSEEAPPATAAVAPDEQLALALAMSRTEAGPPEAAAPSPIAKPISAEAEPTVEPTLVPSGGEVKDDASDDGILVDVSDAGADTVASAEEPAWLREAGERVQPETYAQLIDDLHEMGFTDRALNERLLIKHEGDLKRAVRDIVKAVYT